MSEDIVLGDFAETGGENENQTTQHELFGIGALPTDWEIEPLSEISKIIPGNSPPSSTYNDTGEGLPFFQGNSEFGYLHPEEDTWCSDPRKKAQVNDILISIRAPVGDLNIADRNCCIGRGLAAIRPSRINGLYLYYHFAERQGWLSRLATGSTFKSITKGDLQHLDVPLPPSEQQQKIASVLYNVDQAIQKTDEIIDQTEKVQKGLLQDLVTRGLNQKDELRPSYHEEPSLYREIAGRTVPSEWSVVELSDIGEWISGKTPKKSEDSFWGGSIPWISAKDMKSLHLSDSEDKITEIAVEEGAPLAPADSLLILVRGMILDHTLPVVRPTREVSFNQDVKAIIPYEEINPDYLAYWLKTNSNEVLALVTAASHGTKRLSTGALGNLSIPLPPEDEQVEIVDRVKKFDRKIDTEKSYADRLKSLKKGLMQDLLSGNVRTNEKDIAIFDEVTEYEPE